MSKQLTISATASVLAMALFALFTQIGEPPSPQSHRETGATASAIAPAVGQLVPALPSIR
ncbi:hypothetical protein [Aurantiacibacter xanthus]|uniref:hypothetical protein n=1 Tax=Aurantiacibacter xanthus TaxID=1784712 RepID=UPI0011C214BA|nr:hypothetical protein [Aurantiacibacter xanthus]